MARALIIVDAQPTFCEGGELPVTGGNAAVARIADFASAQRQRYDLVVTTQDWHLDPGDHFSQTPDFVDSWPPHGLAGTPGAELHPALAQLGADLAVKKGQWTAAYSGFEGVDEAGVPLATRLAEAGITDVDVVGLAESHCVLETALDAARLGYHTRVFTDLTEPVTEALGAAARTKMGSAGIQVLSSSDAAL